MFAGTDHDENASGVADVDQQDGGEKEEAEFHGREMEMCWRVDLVAQSNVRSFGKQQLVQSGSGGEFGVHLVGEGFQFALRLAGDSLTG